MFADPAPGPGSLDLFERHIVLVGEAANERRDDPPLRGVAVGGPTLTGGLVVLLVFLRFCLGLGGGLLLGVGLGVLFGIRTLGGGVIALLG